MHPIVKGFDCEWFRMTAHRDIAAGTGAVVRKPSRKETAVRDTSVCVPQGRYGDLGAACDRKYKSIPRAFGDERDRNFDVSA